MADIINLAGSGGLVGGTPHLEPAAAYALASFKLRALYEAHKLSPLPGKLGIGEACRWAEPDSVVYLAPCLEDDGAADVVGVKLMVDRGNGLPAYAVQLHCLEKHLLKVVYPSVATSSDMASYHAFCAVARKLALSSPDWHATEVELIRSHGTPIEVAPRYSLGSMRASSYICNGSCAPPTEVQPVSVEQMSNSLWAFKNAVRLMSYLLIDLLGDISPSNSKMLKMMPQMFPEATKRTWHGTVVWIPLGLLNLFDSFHDKVGRHWYLAPAPLIDPVLDQKWISWFEGYSGKFPLANWPFGPVGPAAVIWTMVRCNHHVYGCPAKLDGCWKYLLADDGGEVAYQQQWQGWLWPIAIYNHAYNDPGAELVSAAIAKYRKLCNIMRSQYSAAPFGGYSTWVKEPGMMLFPIHAEHGYSTGTGDSNSQEMIMSWLNAPGFNDV